MNIAIVNGSNSASKLTIVISQDESDSIRCSAVFFYGKETKMLVKIIENNEYVMTYDFKRWIKLH